MSEKSKKNPGQEQEEAAASSGAGGADRTGSAEKEPSPAEQGARHRSSGSSLFGALLGRGRRELERVAAGTRVRLDLRQLKLDREAMYQKLGRETRALLDGGEIQHPGLQRNVQRIEELDRKIASVEAEMSLAGVPPDPEGDSSP